MGIENILDKRVDYSEDLDEYNSKFEFEKFDIVNIEEKRDLNNKEEKILKTMNTIKKNTFEFSKNLYEAQKILSNHKNGAFVAWFENIGLKKDTVYRAIDKYEIYLNCNNQKVLELPRSIVNTIKKVNLPSNEISEIINSGNIEEILKEKIKNKECNIEIDIEKEISKIDKQIKKNYEKISELENKKEELIQNQ